MQMTPQEIMIGTRLELEMLNSSGERIGNVYVSQLLDLQEDGTMVISAPIFGSRVVFIPDGITIRLTFVHQVHGLLGFTAVVNTRDYRGKIAVLTVTPAADIIKIQRRMHYRLEIILDAVIRPTDAGGNMEGTGAPESTTGDMGITGDTESATGDTGRTGDTDNATEIEAINAYTKNISGAGACIVTEKDFARGTEVLIGVMLPDDRQISAKGIIIRKEMIEVRKGRSYELGVSFTEISKKDQNTLIRFIFEQQRLLLKKDKEK
jgi:c-di-GMP-binding flagellar brake protein YcgR